MNAQPAARRSPGRPKTRVLSHEIILETAFRLADVPGGDFSLAKIARALDVQGPALHHYFGNRAQLIAGMRGQLTERIGDHGFDVKPWYEAIIPWAKAYRDTLGVHPGLIAELATLPVDGEPESIRDYERIVAAMLRDGYPEHRVVPAIVTIECFLIGAALDALTPDDNLHPAGHLEEAPNLARAEEVARRFAHENRRTAPEETFEFGLKVLVEALRAVGSAGDV